MKSRKQKIKEMRESMDKLGEEYDVPEPKTKASKAEKKRKAKIKKKKSIEDKWNPFSVKGLAKKIKRRGKQIKAATEK